MRIPISEIKVSPGRRSAAPADVRELADSIAEIGLLNPVTVSQSRTLIAGFHRLEAAKLLGWTEIECVVSGLEGLRAELAEIDENFVRSDLTPLEFGELLLRRKEIYEALHPESKNGGDRRSEGIRTSSCRSDSVSSFAQDTAEKLGVGRRTVERQVQIAKNLTSEAKDILRGADTPVTRKQALALSRLEPGPQAEDAGPCTGQAHPFVVQKNIAGSCLELAQHGVQAGGGNLQIRAAEFLPHQRFKLPPVNAAQFAQNIQDVFLLNR